MFKLTKDIDSLEIVLIIFALTVSYLAMVDPSFRPNYAELVKLIFSGFLGYIMPKRRTE